VNEATVNATSTAEPGPRRSGKWLDVPRLKAAIYRLTLRQAIDKRTLRSVQRMGISAPAQMSQDAVAYNADQLTLLCALRALHRGKRHVGRQRVFGPGYENGSEVVSRPVRIPAALLNHYRVST
jgi:hypothetical protein